MEKMKVLILDDDKFRGREYAAYLNASRKFSADSTHIIKKAFMMAMENEYDAFILDINMEDDDNVFDIIESQGGYRTGLAVAQKLRDKFPDIKIVALTHSFLPEAVSWFTSDDSYDYFLKDEFTPEEFPDPLYESLNRYYEFEPILSELRPPIEDNSIHPNINKLFSRMKSAHQASDYSAVIHASASIFEVLAKGIISSEEISRQSLGSFFEKYRRESKLPTEILDYIYGVYKRRNTESLAGHGSLAVPTVSHEDSVILLELTRAFVNIEVKLR